MIDYSAAGFTLLQGAHLYAPEDRGICDVLIANGKIIAVASNIPSDIVPDCTVVDLSGQILCPGFIDQHVHLIGGGGEAGPTTRTPEVALSRLTEAGVTSVVGLLGTDSISRHPESLLAKTRALNEEGISAWMLTGAYHVPSRTITGSVEKDVAIIDRVIGVKCAISDHRSAAPDVYHLANMAAESRVGGLLGGKPGVTVFHMGDSKRRYSLSMTCWKTAMCRSASCCRPTLTATFRCLSRRWSSRAKAAPSTSPAALTNQSPLPKVLPAPFRRVFRWHASPSAPTATVASRSLMTKEI